MGKRTRIVLYALSLVTMLAMVTLIIFSHGRQSGEPAKDALSETDIKEQEQGNGKKNTDWFICTVACDIACDGDTDYFFVGKTAQ